MKIKTLSGWGMILISILLLLSGCTTFTTEQYSDTKRSVVSGALSYHWDNKKRDEVNPLGGFEIGAYQCGAYDNSRMRTSASIYCSQRWLNLKIPNTALILNSKVGAALYDNQSHYPWSLKPLLSIGTRIHWTDHIWTDLDYMPQTLIGGKDVASFTLGYVLGAP